MQQAGQSGEVARPVRYERNGVLYVLSHCSSEMERRLFERNPALVAPPSPGRQNPDPR